MNLPDFVDRKEEDTFIYLFLINVYWSPMNNSMKWLYFSLLCLQYITRKQTVADYSMNSGKNDIDLTDEVHFIPLLF